MGHAERLEYEAASRVRDRIQLMERTLRRQQRLADIHQREADILAISRAGDVASGVVLQVRDGRVLGKERRTLRGTAEQDDAAVMAAFVTQYYMRSDTVPPQVITAIEPEEQGTIEAWLTRRAGRRVEMRQARRGPLAGLVRLALQNARLDQEQGRAAGKARRLSPAVYELQAALNLREPPSRIEGFDISNIQGSHPVASLVVMVNGEPARAEYRRFRMRSPGPNDFAMMKEVVGRRAARIVSGEYGRPDLFMIDGGKGQVGAALEALAEVGLVGVPVVGLAKREEELILPGQEESIRLAHSAPALKLLIRLRDEAHRFALQYHRKLRGKSALRSELDRLSGIGETRRLSRRITSARWRRSWRPARPNWRECPGSARRWRAGSSTTCIRWRSPVKAKPPRPGRVLPREGLRRAGLRRGRLPRDSESGPDLSPYLGALDRWLGHLSFERRLAANSVSAYGGDLRHHLAFLAGRGLALDAVTTGHLEQYLTRLYEDGYRATSRARRLATLKSFSPARRAGRPAAGRPRRGAIRTADRSAPAADPDGGTGAATRRSPGGGRRGGAARPRHVRADVRRRASCLGAAGVAARPSRPGVARAARRGQGVQRTHPAAWWRGRPSAGTLARRRPAAAPFAAGSADRAHFRQRARRCTQSHGFLEDPAWACAAGRPAGRPSSSYSAAFIRHSPS